MSIYGKKTRENQEKVGKNPAAECNKIRQKYCPNLFQDFADTKDPEHQSYTEYSNKELLGTVYYKGIAGIESMQTMTYEFNKERVTGNKETAAEIGSMDVDNSFPFYQKIKIWKFEVIRQAIMEFTFQG